MSTRELDAVLTDWKIGLGKLPYLKVLKEEQTYGFNQLVHIRCLSKLPKPNLSIAKADIQRIWRTKVGDGIESGHTFKDTEKGFEFHFVGLSKAATALSGVLVVESNPPRDR